MAHGGMSRSVVTALLIGCLVFGVLLGLIGTNRSSSPSSSNLRDANKANHIQQRAAKATEALAAVAPADEAKHLDLSMFPKSFDKVDESLEAWAPDGEEKGDWNDMFGAGEQFKAFDQLMETEEEMSFMFSYEMDW